MNGKVSHSVHWSVFKLTNYKVFPRGLKEASSLLNNLWSNSFASLTPEPCYREECKQSKIQESANMDALEQTVNIHLVEYIFLNKRKLQIVFFFLFPWIGIQGFNFIFMLIFCLLFHVQEQSYGLASDRQRFRAWVW